MYVTCVYLLSFDNDSSLEYMFVSKQYQRFFHITFYPVISFIPLTGKLSE